MLRTLALILAGGDRKALSLVDHRADEAGSFLLCTHGDVASVLLCAANGLSLSRHRDVGAMGNGEVRPLPAHALAGLSGFR